VRGSWWSWAGFLLCAGVAVGFFFIPAFIIRPFRYQSPRALWIAMMLRQAAPVATLIGAAGCVVLAIVLWRSVGRWRKAVVGLALLGVAFSTAMARLNYFEWMFHPIDGPQFVGQSESKLDGKEMILAVRLGGDARAYPISQMAYHHVLNDVADGVPIAVTY